MLCSLPLPLAVQDRATKDNACRGYPTPVGATAISNTYPDPESFNPDGSLKDRKINRLVSNSKNRVFEGKGETLLITNNRTCAGRICPSRQLVFRTCYPISPIVSSTPEGWSVLCRQFHLRHRRPFEHPAQSQRAILHAFLLTIDGFAAPRETPTIPPVHEYSPSEIVTATCLMYASLLISLLAALSRY